MGVRSHRFWWAGHAEAAVLAGTRRTMHTNRLFAVVAATALGTVLPFTATTPAAAQQAAPAGAISDAFALLVDVTALAGNVPVQAGPISEASSTCPPESPAADDVVLDVAVPAAGTVATSETLRASADTDCAQPAAVARAITEGATVLTPVAGGPSLLTAEVIESTATADCEDLTATTEFVGLTLTNPNNASQSIDVPANPPPNTRIDIPGVATIILNEQQPLQDGRGILVNGVHIIGASDLLRGDIIISHALAGVACPNGAGPEAPEGLELPAVTFQKDANPTTAQPGDTVTYTATVNNTGDEDCDVLRFIDHLNPVFEFVSTTGDFGDEAETEQRTDGGTDVVLRPGDTVIAAGASATQTFVVRVGPNTGPGTYFNSLEIFCSQNGNFASGPLAGVTVPAAAVAAPAVQQPAAQPPAAPPPAARQLPQTGAVPLTAAGALLLLAAGGWGLRRTLRRGSPT
jgi:uncharacterized repeat protein (TIGR01451 family)/LPXTG-motif cell wall-anchored protein